MLLKKTKKYLPKPIATLKKNVTFAINKKFDLMEKIDTLDKKILEIVMNNARIPSKDVAQVCGVSRAAVHQRIQRLIDDGFVFTRYLATEYHEYEHETVFLKESCIAREELSLEEVFDG